MLDRVYFLPLVCVNDFITPNTTSLSNQFLTIANQKGTSKPTGISGLKFTSPPTKSVKASSSRGGGKVKAQPLASDPLGSTRDDAGADGGSGPMEGTQAVPSLEKKKKVAIAEPAQSIQYPGFDAVGKPIREDEFAYLVHKVQAARDAKLDDLNDFGPDDEARAAEIFKQWARAGSPATFTDFVMNLKAQTSGAPPTEATSSDNLAKTLSSKFGLPSETIKAYTAAVVERANGKKESSAKQPRTPRTKPLSGVALAAITKVIEGSLEELSRTAWEHKVDPSTAMQLFSRVLTYFGGDVWNAYQLKHSLRRAQKAQGMVICLM